MGRKSWVIGLLTVCLCSGLQGQDKTNPADKASNSGQQINQDDSQTDEQQQGTADTPGAAEAASMANDNNSGTQNADSGAATSNVPAVSQTTSSDSGSPAVLSSENGKN